MRPDRDLDRELRDLGPHVEYPPTPDLARSVRDRLEAESQPASPPARARPQLWWIAAAALVLLVALPVFAMVLTSGGFMSRGAGSAGGGGEMVAQGGREAGGTQPADDATPAPGGGDMPTSGGGKVRPTSGGGDDMPTSGGGSESAASSGAQASGSGLQAATVPNDRRVPNVVGLPVLDACGELRSRDYVGTVRGEVEKDSVAAGRVVSQRPRPGRKGFRGQPVELVVSAPYPAGKLGRDVRCYDATEYGPGGRPNVPNAEGGR